jgi:hypothetical protein
MNYYGWNAKTNLTVMPSRNTHNTNQPTLPYQNNHTRLTVIPLYNRYETLIIN